MVNANGRAAAGIRCRQIGEADLAAVAALLSRGFHSHSERFWSDALSQLTAREPPAGLPKYGYLLDCSGVPVGAILLICASIRRGEDVETRCNLSSWYVEPAFRAYATLLVSQALQHKGITYLNVSAAPHTWPIIEAQGFSRYCDGIFVALPMLSRAPASVVRILPAEREPSVPYHSSDREILLQHRAHGCIGFWCEAADRAYPFIFRPRTVKRMIPCAQLIYCNDVADFVRFAGPIGRHLARRGRPVVIVDSNGPIPELIGVFRRGNMAKYFKGPRRPRLGDLAFTEYAILGV